MKYKGTITLLTMGCLLAGGFVACSDDDDKTTCTCEDVDGYTYTANPADYGATNCGALAAMAAGHDGETYYCY